MLAMVLATVLTFTGATPQKAALAVAGGSALRSNVDAPYATVLTRGGIVLLQHFSFGWQALEFLHDRCDLMSVPRFDVPKLMQGMPPVAIYRSECLRTVDNGPANEIDTVRSLVGKPYVASVIVSGDWAVSRSYTAPANGAHFDARFYWYHGGGAELLFHKTNGSWHLAGGNDGALTAQEINAAGAPHDEMCAFHLYNMACGFVP